MQYGVCSLSIVPVRSEANDRAEMVTQLLYGDVFEIISIQKNWVHIRIAFDFYEGWIDVKQFITIEESQFNAIKELPFYCSIDFIEFVNTQNNQLLPISIGSCLSALQLLKHQFDGAFVKPTSFLKEKISEIASLYLNAPYQWGGKTPFGIDCSGFTQMVYRICGFSLLRDASQQAKQGTALSFIEESEPGDLAFFDNADGNIIHVGIVLGDNYIIHAHGQVRIDRLDHTGIFNAETKNYSHNLRVIKSFS
ncbi:C40 family peptidase [Psychroflexus salis]|uniref:Hydrolase Nlp/P60 n=1 Tax=Psychroflexus salis TaxID=1526574 RepID=A0A916ZUU4_9FLAO|nr:C40 family peptidase [Psychroflexus salis]GGE15050.1 hydrolase Nlp/P60 [Psychroflexus salis]